MLIGSLLSSLLSDMIITKGVTLPVIKKHCDHKVPPFCVYLSHIFWFPYL